MGKKSRDKGAKKEEKPKKDPSKNGVAAVKIARETQTRIIRYDVGVGTGSVYKPHRV